MLQILYGSQPSQRCVPTGATSTKDSRATLRTDMRFDMCYNGPRKRPCFGSVPLGLNRISTVAHMQPPLKQHPEASSTLAETRGCTEISGSESFSLLSFESCMAQLDQKHVLIPHNVPDKMTYTHCFWIAEPYLGWTYMVPCRRVDSPPPPGEGGGRGGAGQRCTTYRTLFQDYIRGLTKVLI